MLLPPPPALAGCIWVRLGPSLLCVLPGWHHFLAVLPVWPRPPGPGPRTPARAVGTKGGPRARGSFFLTGAQKFWGQLSSDGLWFCAHSWAEPCGHGQTH